MLLAFLARLCIGKEWVCVAEKGVVGVWTLVGVDAVGSEANGVEGWGGEGRKKGAKVGRSAEEGQGVMGSSPISSREFFAL